MVGTHTGDLDQSSKWTVVGAACAANDMVDVAEAPDLATAAEQALINFGG